MVKRGFTRRNFMVGSSLAAGSLGFPAIIPARVLGNEAPSKKIQVGVVGCGRIALGMDIPGVWNSRDMATVVALADCDAHRLHVTADRTRKRFEGDLPELKLYDDYRELLSDRSVDAVMFCTPEHWHAQQAVEAVAAGKDIYIQKPLAMTVFEGREIVKAVERSGRVFHIGTQQRSEGGGTFGPQFRKAVEYVRSGRIGRVLRVEIGLPSDPAEPSNAPLEQPIPDNLNYDQWLGVAPEAPYSELRTHPQGSGRNANFGRPGWMVIQDYSMGMIANWGAHHIDIGQWALDMEGSGPVRVSGKAEFPQRRLWDAHGKMDVTLEYAGGTIMHVADESVYPNGVRFVGEKGWIFCSRSSAKATIDDPGAGGKHGRWRPLEASKAELIAGDAEVKVARNPSNHHRVWFESIRSRQPTNITVESAHRTTTACILAFNAMNLKRPLQWDPKAERYINDDDANATLARPERGNYGVGNALKRLGVEA